MFLLVQFNKSRYINMMLSNLKEKIRYGKEPDNPMLISLWLTEEERCRDIKNTQQDLSCHYQAQFYLLLEAVADELNPAHWRRVCLDNIYKPICSLQRTAQTEVSRQKVQKLLQELAVTCEYVKHSLHH